MTIDQIRNWAQTNYPKWVAAAGKKISCVTVIPGYDDTKLKRPAPRPTTSRYGGETYRVLWQEAIAARPDWILVTSWNELHEGSEIEPTKENGDRELAATKQFAQSFLGRRQTKKFLKRP
jgi:glycoprotein endo-alpha-1,2-mannosidase